MKLLLIGLSVIALAVGAFAVGNFMFQKTPPGAVAVASPTQPEAVRELKLHGDISVVSDSIKVLNLDKTAWTDVQVSLVCGTSTFYVINLGNLAPGCSPNLYANQFATTDGERFNPYLKKASYVLVEATTAKGRGRLIENLR